MNSSQKVAVVPALVAAALALALPGEAEARRGGGVHVSAGVHVGGAIIVGVPAPAPPPPPTYYAPPAPPVYYAQPAPQPYYGVAAVRVWRPRLGLGLWASSVDVNDGALEGSGGGVFMRLPIRRVELEFALSQDHFDRAERVDTRAGIGVIYHLRPGQWQPYLLGGLGVNIVEPLGPEATMSSEALPQQSYAELGVGIRWNPLPRLALSLDARAQARELAQDKDDLSFRYQGMRTSERAAELRLAGIVYF